MMEEFYKEINNKLGDQQSLEGINSEALWDSIKLDLDNKPKPAGFFTSTTSLLSVFFIASLTIGLAALYFYPSSPTTTREELATIATTETITTIEVAAEAVSTAISETIAAVSVAENPASSTSIESSIATDNKNNTNRESQISVASNGAETHEIIEKKSVPEKTRRTLQTISASPEQLTTEAEKTTKNVEREKEVELQLSESLPVGLSGDDIEGATVFFSEKKTDNIANSADLLRDDLARNHDRNTANAWSDDSVEVAKVKVGEEEAKGNNVQELRKKVNAIALSNERTQTAFNREEIDLPKLISQSAQIKESKWASAKRKIKPAMTPNPVSLLPILKGKLSVAVLMGSNLFSQSFNASGASDADYAVTLNSSYSTSASFSYNLEFDYQLGKSNFFLRSGIAMSELENKFSWAESVDSSFVMETPLGNRLVNGVLRRTVLHHTNQVLLSMPVQLVYGFDFGKWETRVGLGPRVNYSFGESGRTLAEQGNIITYSKQASAILPSTSFFISYHGSVEFVYALTEKFSALARTDLGYYRFGQSPLFGIKRTGSSVSGQLGLRFRF